MTTPTPTHTPGPWHAYIEIETICILGPDVSHHRPVVHWMGFDDCGRAQAENEANSHLIAAAPDMLEAIYNLLGVVDTPVGRAKLGLDPDDEVLKQARAALSKALGEDE